jgi:hypothetical protein
MRKIPPLPPDIPPDVRKHLETVFGAIRENIAKLFRLDIARVKVSESDEQPGALEEKIVAGTGITVTPATVNNKEVLQISASGGGGGGLADAYAHITDGTNTANASGGDTFKLRSANNALTIGVSNDDPVHGDNALFTIVPSNIDHGSLGGLSDDDHSQYFLLAGRAGGQVAKGGTGASDTLRLYGTSASSSYAELSGDITLSLNGVQPGIGFIDTSSGEDDFQIYANANELFFRNSTDAITAFKINTSNNLDCNSRNINNVANPVAAQDAATKAYVDAQKDAITSTTDDTDTTLSDAVETTVLTLNVTWSATASKKLIHYGVHWTSNTASGTRADMRVRVYRGTTLIYQQTTFQPSTLGITVTNKDVGVIDDSAAGAGAQTYTIKVTHTRTGTGASTGIVTWRYMIADERKQ